MRLIERTRELSGTPAEIREYELLIGKDDVQKDGEKIFKICKWQAELVLLSHRLIVEHGGQPIPHADLKAMLLKAQRRWNEKTIGTQLSRMAVLGFLNRNNGRFAPLTADQLEKVKSAGRLN